MPTKQIVSDSKLYNFITLAAQSTYPANKPLEKSPQRPGFEEITFVHDSLNYRDSFVAGNLKSAGMELVRYNKQPIWYSNYGGGIVSSQSKFGGQAIAFLKKAFLKRTSDPEFKSFRGPRSFDEDDWNYTYNQQGDVSEFNGYEEIKYKGKLVFYHRVFGGRLY